MNIMMGAGFINIMIIAGMISLACTTKVSEWVLLNVDPEPYLLVCYHNPASAEKASEMNKAVEGAVKDANIRTRTVARDNIRTASFTLYYRNMPLAEFAGTEELSGLSSSPLREKIAGEIMAGRLCVMLFLKSGNPVPDEQRLGILRNSVASSPFGSVITIVELDRKNMTEKHFINMLLNVEADLKDLDEPMLFGIFGRFRALEPLVGKGISSENIGLMVDFLTADCSCVIKDDLPGADILFTNRWEDPMPALVNRILDADPSLLHH